MSSATNFCHLHPETLLLSKHLVISALGFTKKRSSSKHRLRAAEAALST